MTLGLDVHGRMAVFHHLFGHLHVVQDVPQGVQASSLDGGHWDGVSGHLVELREVLLDIKGIRKTAKWLLKKHERHNKQHRNILYREKDSSHIVISTLKLPKT